MNRNLRIGIFSAIGVALIIGFSIYVNDTPYWYRPCNKVKIHVDDATGLRRKSPVRTLGLEIGFINNVTLDGEKVLITVCVTGPVKLNPDTKAYIRSQGFLGDKFLELRPVDLNGAVTPEKTSRVESPAPVAAETKEIPAEPTKDEVKSVSGAPVEETKNTKPGTVILDKVDPNTKKKSKQENSSAPLKSHGRIFSLLFPNIALADEAFAGEALAAAPPVKEGPTLSASRETEIQDMVKKVGKLVDQLTLMVGDLREVTQQKDFKEMVVNLNSAMKHLEFLLRPNGKLIKNLDATMESLKNTMANAEVVMAKVKNGEGTVGKFINDPSIFDDIKTAIKNVNMLLGKASNLKTYVELEADSMPTYDGTKGKFSLLIAPNPTKYYLVGIALDTRGKDRKTTTFTTVNGSPVTTEVKTVNEESGIKLTAVFGKYFGGLDLRAGFIESNGAVGAGYWFDEDRKYGIHADIYSPGKGQGLTARIYGKARVYSALYLTGGIDSLTKYNYNNAKKSTYYFGAGLFFDDEDIKYLLAFK